MSRLVVFLFISFTGFLSAEDSALTLMRSQLLPMRSSQTFNMKARGATAALTTVKHELIAWIESRLAVLPPLSDARALQSQLNDELKSAGLFCGTTAKIKCDQQNPLGSLDKIVLDRQGSDLLVVRTSVGVQVCGVDESAYAYAWQEGRWQRFWDSEQDDYRENKYSPQRFDQVLVSDSAPDHLI